MGIGPITAHDITPIVFSVCAGLMFWGIHRFELFRLVPIAWERVLGAMETGVVVVDESGRVVDLNPFCRVFETEEGTRGWDVFKDTRTGCLNLKGSDQHLELLQTVGAKSITKYLHQPSPITGSFAWKGFCDKRHHCSTASPSKA